MTTRFMAVFDAHVGFERVVGAGRPVALHDPTAIRAAVKFAEDFKPHHLILGGDILDCGAVSHHHAGKPGRTEGLRLLRDMKLAKELVIDPLEATCERGRRVYHKGNHEAWLDQLVEKEPGLEELVDLRANLGLGRTWEVIEQGGLSNLGRLYFAHGDQVRGSEHCAKSAVLDFNRSISFGHFHTLQQFTLTSAIDEELPKVGTAVPCLCRKNPAYGKARPNRWAQGFAYGWIHPDGRFYQSLAVIINGRTIISGQEYDGRRAA